MKNKKEALLLSIPAIIVLCLVSFLYLNKVKKRKNEK
tara:strand:- start:578 stop:688 length:111 start_codon:yes stop_codon:yes gene_type:complete